MKKKTTVIMYLILLLSILSGCAEAPQTDEEGGMIYMTAEEIGLKGEGYEGFFVLNSDGTFAPLANQFEGYQGQADKSSPTRYLWFTNNEVQVSRLIPTVNNDSKLVAIYNTDSVMPDSCTLEKYVFKGYTIGCHIYKSKNNSLYLCATGGLSGSNAAESMGVVDDEAEYRITTINGSEDLPLSNVDNNMQMLLGLEKDLYYEFQFYKGTKFRTLTTIADTQVLQSEEVIILNNLYETTREGYFMINLPDNLESGYYYIAGSGLFKYQE